MGFAGAFHRSLLFGWQARPVRLTSGCLSASLGPGGSLYWLYWLFAYLVGRRETYLVVRLYVVAPALTSLLEPNAQLVCFYTATAVY